ncbi:MAG: hypothetical protein GVY36_13495 [Verrucomicrobia bacterium]|nr:hypothetical protein [Verrucomicrobiota bacterium]
MTAALDGEISDGELEGTAHPAEPTHLDHAFEAQKRDEALITVEEAQAKLPPEVLQVLATQFKGRLTQVRHRDERDQIF